MCIDRPSRRYLTVISPAASQLRVDRAGLNEQPRGFRLTADEAWAGRLFAKRPTASLVRRPAELLQAGTPFLPLGGVEDADGRQCVHFKTGNHLGPEQDPLRIAAQGLRNLPQP